MKRLLVRSIVTGLFFAAFVLPGPEATEAGVVVLTSKHQFKKSASKRECRGDGYKGYTNISLSRCKYYCSNDNKCKYIDYATKKRRGTSRCELNRICKMKKDKRYDVFRKIRKKKKRRTARRKRVTKKRVCTSWGCTPSSTVAPRRKRVTKKRVTRKRIGKAIRATARVTKKVKGELLILRKKWRARAEKICNLLGFGLPSA